MAEAADDQRAVWSRLCAIHLAAPERSSRLGVLHGVLTAIDARDPGLGGELRDACLADPALRADYPGVAVRAPITQHEFARLMYALETVDDGAYRFSDFVWRTEFELKDPDRVQLLAAMLRKPRGAEAVVDALNMLRHTAGDALPWPEEIALLGMRAVTEAMSRIDGVSDPIREHRLVEVLKAVLPDRDGHRAEGAVLELLRHVRRHLGFNHALEKTAATLAKRAPQAFLEGILGSQGLNLSERRQFFSRSFRERSVLDDVASADLAAWCSAGDPGRWEIVAESIHPFTREEGVLRLSKQAMDLLASAPRPAEVATGLATRLAPRSWSGSRAAIIGERVAAFRQLLDHPDPAVRDVVPPLLQEAEEARGNAEQAERLGSIERDQRFE